MKKSRFTESQIGGILKASDAGVPVNEIGRKHGIRSATYYSQLAMISFPVLRVPAYR